jgi:hypothetical protein
VQEIFPQLATFAREESAATVMQGSDHYLFVPVVQQHCRYLHRRGHRRYGDKRPRTFALMTGLQQPRKAHPPGGLCPSNVAGIFVAIRTRLATVNLLQDEASAR